MHTYAHTHTHTHTHSQTMSVQMCIYPVFAAPTRLHSQNAFSAGTCWGLQGYREVRTLILSCGNTCRINIRVNNRISMHQYSSQYSHQHSSPHSSQHSHQHSFHICICISIPCTSALTIDMRTRDVHVQLNVMQKSKQTSKRK